MSTQLTVTAVEESTYIVVATFVDEDDALITPNTITWTLSDLDGTIINSRENVSITPDTSVNIVLSGDDLAVSGSRTRVVTVKATYDSSYGVGLTLKAAAKFDIENLVVVT